MKKLESITNPKFLISQEEQLKTYGGGAGKYVASGETYETRPGDGCGYMDWRQTDICISLQEA